MSTEKKLILIFLIFVSIFAYGIYNLFQPERFPIRFLRGKAIQINENLILGPYPSAKELLKLKRIGVTIVINLMSPENPIEAALIKEEDRLCQQYKLICVSFPMSFIKIHSDSNSRQIEEVVKYIQSNPGKKYYVHCYLGRHRVQLIKERLVQPSRPSESGSLKTP